MVFDHLMTRTSDQQEATEQSPSAARRRILSRVPIWVRLSVIVIVVLAGILLSSVLLGAASVGDRQGSRGGHGSGAGMEMTDQGGSSGDHSGGNHGTGGAHSGGNHGTGAGHDSSNGGG
jgi:hypothetical protein